MKISPFSIENKINSPISITHDCLANPYCIACADEPDSLDKKDRLIHFQFAEPIVALDLHSGSGSRLSAFADALYQFIEKYSEDRTIIFNLYTTHVKLGESNKYTYTSIPLKTSLVYSDQSNSVIFEFKSLIDGTDIDLLDYILGDIYITKIPTQVEQE